jgi:lipoprotein-anchoring transpeptidase ErfK/SrfK
MYKYILRWCLSTLLVFCMLCSFFMIFSTSSVAATGSKLIDVNLTQQRLVAYEGQKAVYRTLILSGRPGLDTPIGTYHVILKQSPTTFYSPFPPSSPNWYPPTHINHALEFKSDGYYLHDSWWHTKYGPGTNGMHYDPVYGEQNGSHGCISMPDSAASWLYRWAPIGTTVRIHY